MIRLTKCKLIVKEKKSLDGTFKAIRAYQLIATIIHGCWVLKILKTSKWHFSSSKTADFGQIK